MSDLNSFLQEQFALITANLRTKMGACVSDPTLQMSLNAKIDGQAWLSFMEEVMAQKGKAIAPDCAAQLFQLAHYLLNNPPPR